MTTAKAYAALVGSIATALLGVFTGDTAVGKILTVVAVAATAFATYRIPNQTGGARRNDAGGVSGDMVLAVFLGATGAGVVLWLLGLLLVGRM